MSKNFRQSVEEVFNDIQKFTDDIQELAVFALEQGRMGNIQYANQLVELVIKSEMLEPNFIIEWFEVFGKLKWNNKKGRLVNYEQGRWLLSKAQAVHWAEIPLGKLSKGMPPKQNVQKLNYEHLTEDNFPTAIHSYLQAHPVNSSLIGQKGLPADKNRWGKYKIKLKRR
ncbi:hypothetical protein [Rheinheimera gaetbuli]